MPLVNYNSVSFLLEASIVLLMVIFVLFLKLLLDNVFDSFLVLVFLDSFSIEIFFLGLASIFRTSFFSDVTLCLVVLLIYLQVVLHKAAANFLWLIYYRRFSKKGFGAFWFSHSSQESRTCVLHYCEGLRNLELSCLFSKDPFDF